MDALSPADVYGTCEVNNGLENGIQTGNGGIGL
jgi:hypothetical protein